MTLEWPPKKPLSFTGAENIKTDGDFILIDYVDTDFNGYHSWTITIENGVPVATDGGFAEYYTTLDLINNMPFYASYDKWVNGTYSAHSHPRLHLHRKQRQDYRNLCGRL